MYVGQQDSRLNENKRFSGVSLVPQVFSRFRSDFCKFTKVRMLFR